MVLNEVMLTYLVGQNTPGFRKLKNDVSAIVHSHAFGPLSSAG